jgi:hypothetical protein
MVAVKMDESVVVALEPSQPNAIKRTEETQEITQKQSSFTV